MFFTFRLDHPTTPPNQASASCCCPSVQGTAVRPAIFLWPQQEEKRKAHCYELSYRGGRNGRAFACQRDTFHSLRAGFRTGRARDA